MARMTEPKPLIIVESPAKARTISKFLGSDWVVESSIGHIRDLPPSAAEIPKKYKGEKWARLGIDVNNEFKPLYVVPAEKKKQVAAPPTATDVPQREAVGGGATLVVVKPATKGR